LLAFATATGPGSLIRQAEHLKPELAEGIASISSQGFIVPPRPSATNNAMKEKAGVITEKKISPDGVKHMTMQPSTHQSLLERMETMHSRIARIADVHMRPHSMGSYVSLISRYIQSSPLQSQSQKTKPKLVKIGDVVVVVPEAAGTTSAIDPTLTGGAGPVAQPIVNGSVPPVGPLLPGQDGGMAVDDAESDTLQPPNLQLWAVGFFTSLLALGFAASHVGGKMKVELQPRDDLAQARGRPCWTFCCAAWVVVLAGITFFFTLLVLSSVGLESRTDGYDGEGVVLHKSRHPGERAFEAGQGVALSVGLMALLIFRRRHDYSVRISSGLLAQYAIRGAVLSCSIAAVLEISGISFVEKMTGLRESDLLPSADKLSGPGPLLLGVFLSMAMVGVAEELAKLAAMLFGTWLSASAVRLEPANYWRQMWRVLVESPRALMLAGLAVGCGFMTLENVGYLLSAGLMYYKEDSAVAERIIRCIIVGVRVGLNLHPWLAGITSARVASLCFGQGRPYLSLSFSELAWALWPAVALHSGFDFGLVALPGLVAIFLPPFAWIASRHVFNQEWDKFASSVQDNTDPTEESTAAPAGQRD